jgi:hypothetical protein
MTLYNICIRSSLSIFNQMINFTSMKTIEEINQELETNDITTSKIYEGIMTKDSWYAWKRRGLPKNVIKYFQILARLEELTNPKPKPTPEPKQIGWGSSSKHNI